LEERWSSRSTKSASMRWRSAKVAVLQVVLPSSKVTNLLKDTFTNLGLQLVGQ